MAWTNAFDIGDCTLTVHKDGSATAMTPVEMTADGVSVAADAAGLVTLTAPAIAGTGSYEVRVTPSYDTVSSPVRLSEMFDDGIGNGLNFYPSWSPVPQTYDGSGVPTGGETGGADPYTFTPDQSWAFAGVAILGGGG